VEDEEANSLPVVTLPSVLAFARAEVNTDDGVVGFARRNVNTGDGVIEFDRPDRQH
jgi:hypothetical protein